MVVRPVLLYTVGCWGIKKILVQRMIAAEKRMLHWMSCHMRLGKIRDKVIRNIVRLAPIKNNIRDVRLRWLVMQEKGAQKHK